MNKRNVLLFVALANAQSALTELEEAGKVYGFTNTPYYIARHRSLKNKFEAVQDSIESSSDMTIKATINKPKITLRNFIEEERPAAKQQRINMRLSDILDIVTKASYAPDDINNIVIVAPQNISYRPTVNQWLTREFDIYVE